MKRKAVLVLAMLLVLSIALIGTSSAALPGSGWWTSFVVQNLDTTNTVQVGAEAYAVQGDANASIYSFSDSISPLASKTFHPAFCGVGGSNFPCLNAGGSPLPAGFNGSTVLSAGGNIAAAVQVGNNPQGTVGTPGGTASAQYNGKAVGSQTLGFPLVKHNYFNKTTTFYVQAAGADASVTASYKMNNGATFSDGPHNISANRTYIFDPVAAGVPNNTCGNAANTSRCVGAVTFTSSTGDVVATVVEHEHSASPGKIAQSTSLFVDGDEGATVFCPIYKNSYPVQKPRTTGMMVQNVGAAATDVRISIVVAAGPNAGSTYSNTVTNVAPGKSVVFFPSDNNIGGMPAGNFGPVTVQAYLGGSPNAAGKLVASVNEANFDGSVVRATTYGCFASTSASDTVSLPIMKEDFGAIGRVNRTGVVMQNVGTGSTTISPIFTCSVNNTTQTYTHVNITLAPGTGKDIYNPSASGANWVGTPLPSGVLCAVTLTATPGTSIVGIAQEAASPADPSTDLDTKNYEGFPVN